MTLPSPASTPSPTPGDLEDVPSRLATKWLARQYVFRRELDSTNTLAARMADEGAEHGLVVVADEQSSGRGRMQREWHSPAGLNLYFSIVLRPTWNTAASPPVSITAGVAIAEGVRDFVSEVPQLKWPNDILCGGRKVAGILVEGVAHRERLQQLVLGIGVNVNQRIFPAPLSERATSLSLASGREGLDRVAVLLELLSRVEYWIDRLAEGSGQDIIRRWCDFAPWLGSPLRVSQSGTTITGTAIGLDPGGALLLRDEFGEVRTLHCGDASGVMGWAY